MREDNEQVIKDTRRIAGKADDSDWIPASPQELTNLIFSTCYLGSKNSSSDTRQRASALARDINAYHVNVDIDNVGSFEALISSLAMLM